MENLTKQQIVLLTLLVSFVTSIATGIFTVSLMDQAPKGVTQTINRVVERTVEKVIPSTSSAAAIVSKETVVVNSDDMVVAAVEKNRGNLIRIMKVREEYGTTKEKLGGLAIPVSKDLLAADVSVIAKDLDAFGSIIPESYKAVTADGKSFAVLPVGVDEANSLVFFSVMGADGKKDLSVSFNPVTLGNSDSLKLGQTVIAIGGQDNDVISTGIISSLVDKNEKSAGSPSYSLIKTNISFADGVSGTILVNLSGELVGILAGKYSGRGTFLPSNGIATGLQNVLKSSGGLPQTP